MKEKKYNGQNSVATSANYKVMSAKKVDDNHYRVNVKFTFSDGRVEKVSFIAYTDSYGDEEDARREVDRTTDYARSTTHFTDFCNFVKYIQGWLDYYDFSKPEASQPTMDEDKPVVKKEDVKNAVKGAMKICTENVGKIGRCSINEQYDVRVSKPFGEYEFNLIVRDSLGLHKCIHNVRADISKMSDYELLCGDFAEVVTSEFMTNFDGTEA